MKIKIEEPGYEGLNGQMGSVDFEDGVSVSEVNPRQVSMLASIIRIVDAETGEQIGPNFDFAKMMDVEAESVPMNYAQPGEADAKPKDVQYINKGATNDNGKAYTQEELEAIADKEGINGVRKIADKIGVKANSIAALISKIVKG